MNKSNKLIQSAVLEIYDENNELINEIDLTKEKEKEEISIQFYKEFEVEPKKQNAWNKICGLE